MVPKEEFSKKVSSSVLGIGNWGTFTLSPNKIKMAEELFSALIPVFIFGLIGVACYYSGPPERDTKFDDISK